MLHPVRLSHVVVQRPKHSLKMNVQTERRKTSRDGPCGPLELRVRLADGEHLAVEQFVIGEAKPVAIGTLARKR
jgi:hypothetical protein